MSTSRDALRTTGRAIAGAKHYAARQIIPTALAVGAGAEYHPHIPIASTGFVIFYGLTAGIPRLMETVQARTAVAHARSVLRSRHVWYEGPQPPPARPAHLVNVSDNAAIQVQIMPHSRPRKEMKNSIDVDELDRGLLADMITLDGENKLLDVSVPVNLWLVAAATDAVLHARGIPGFATAGLTALTAAGAQIGTPVLRESVARRTASVRERVARR